MNDCVFKSITIDPEESRKVTLNLFRWCANYWRANEQFDAAEYIRPTRPNGFAFQASGSGTSGNREPNWPTTLAATVQDGGITWTCVAAGSNGLNAITSPVGASDPTGLTIAAVSVSESTKILATYSGGTLGNDYDAKYTFLLNGVTRVARQPVCVRKR